MAIIITNISDQLTIVPFNSGKAVYVAPGESSSPIEELEINGNEKVEKLLKANLITTTKVATAKEPEDKLELQPEAEPEIRPEAELEPQPEAEPEKKSKSKKGGKVVINK